MSIIIPIAYFFLANISTIIFTKKSFGTCLPLTVMLSTIILFLSQFMLHTFNVGLIIIIIYSIIPIVNLIYNKLNKQEMNIKEKIITPGLVSFIVISILVIIYDFTRSFSMWDEFSHWGVMVKEMIRLDSFYSDINSTLMVHKDYPPIYSIYELLWIKLCGTYNESYLITSMHFFELTMFIPSMTELEFKTGKLFKCIINTIIGITIIALIIIFLDKDQIYNSIYIDYSLGIFLAYIYYSIISSKEKEDNFLLFNLMLSSIFLLLTKQIGLPLYISILFLYFMYIKIDWHNLMRLCKIILFIIIIPIAFYISWNKYISTISVDSQFITSNIEVSKLPSIINGTSGTIAQKDAAKNYLNALLHKNITSSYIKLSFIELVIIGIVILTIILFLNKNKFSKRQSLIIIVTLILLSVGYAFVMLNMYVFCFDEFEGPNLASYERYMSTVVLTIYALIFMISYKLWNRKYLYTLIILIILISIQQPHRIKIALTNDNKEYLITYKNTASYLESKIDNNSKVFIISDGNDGLSQFAIKYYANPIITNLKYFSTNSWNEDLIDYMGEYDYLYILSIDDNFVENSSIKADNKFEIGNLYKINKTGKAIKLVLVN